MAYYLNFVYSAAGDKYFNCNIPPSTSNAGRPLQIEWEMEFEAKKSVDQFIVASLSSAGAANVLFLQSGTNFEFRSEGNANWVVTTGVTLTNFNIFRIRSTFDGTTRSQTLHINGNLIATRHPTTATVGAFGVITGLNSSATRGGALKYLKYTDFVTPASNRLYDANLSNGTGTILPEAIYGINATQAGVWPTDDSEWVFYSSGSDTATFAGTLPKLSASISASVSVPANATYFAGVMPKLTANAAVTVNAPAVQASFSGVMPKLSASASVTVGVGALSVSFSGALPKLSASALINVAVGASISGVMPLLRMSASLFAAAPQKTGDPLALKQALVNQRRAEEYRNNEYVPPVVIVPEWWIVQQKALSLKQAEVNKSRESED